ncbi:hydrogenase 4 subunit B [Immundisolibacter sp.]|uniref:hydrogenase 4 subunit B n=1 Tax=Immundisolibacter sp. TaxID=1934948 RepID=UPI002621B3D0|nr:hydrogenase 4 subunit B [Immundisolibacter sp.]MDD3652250.1 hydrogenase 4 subunit B [Immundisolibacter sp.]
MLCSNWAWFGVRAAPVAWLLLGLLGLLRPRGLRFVAHGLFPAGAVVGVALAVCAWQALAAGSCAAVLPLGLPELPMHLRLDALSAFFLLLLGGAAAAVSVFSAGYFRAGEGTAPGLLALQYHLFLAAMAWVLLADDAYAFMVAWEVMALASFFLVTSQHRVPEVRRAGFLYLLIAHLGAIAVLLCFGVLQGGSWQFTFDAMRRAQLSPGWASVAFALAVFGFGAKAGLVPLHAWLPEAHPAAPSPVSALMSGVMLKTAVYGLLRVGFDLLGAPHWSWGAALLALGLFSALFGVMFAAVQTDMKRLLAYSSIENLGLICAAVGLAMLFDGSGQRPFAALALAAALFHCLNHALFKSLLFLATGSVLHATQQRSLGKLGGLIRRMPWVAWPTLVASLAIAGLPPLNGFVSEWLLLQAFLVSPRLPLAFVNMLVPVGAALLVLASALAGYVMVKFYGVIFLGRMREPQLAHAHDAGWFERVALLALAGACIGLGLLPALLLERLNATVGLLVGSAATRWGDLGWLRAGAVSAASFSPLLFAAGIALVMLGGFAAIRRLYHGRVSRGAPWDCGYPWQDARMQDTAEGFGQPIRQIFEPFFRMRRHLPSPFDASPRYEVTVEDRFWYLLYRPIAGAVERAAGLVGRLQQGRIAVYLLYGFATLVALLVLVL